HVRSADQADTFTEKKLLRRFIDLRKPPFCFCEPLLFIDDDAPDKPQQKLGLWERSQLNTVLASNKQLAAVVASFHSERRRQTRR
ncbi:MAG: hypothetical protein WCO77_07925, partial [bacterium]